MYVGAEIAADLSGPMSFADVNIFVVIKIELIIADAKCRNKFVVNAL